MNQSLVLALMVGGGVALAARRLKSRALGDVTPAITALVAGGATAGAEAMQVIPSGSPGVWAVAGLAAAIGGFAGMAETNILAPESLLNQEPPSQPPAPPAGE